MVEQITAARTRADGRSTDPPDMATRDDPSMKSTPHPTTGRADVAGVPRPGEPPSARVARQRAADQARAQYDFGERIEVIALAGWQVDAARQEWWRPLLVHPQAHPDRPVWLVFTVRFTAGEGAVVHSAHAADRTGATWGMARAPANAGLLLDAADRELLRDALESHRARLSGSAAATRSVAMHLADLQERLNRMTTGG